MYSCDRSRRRGRGDASKPRHLTRGREAFAVRPSSAIPPARAPSSSAKFGPVDGEEIVEREQHRLNSTLPKAAAALCAPHLRPRLAAAHSRTPSNSHPALTYMINCDCYETRGRSLSPAKAAKRATLCAPAQLARPARTSCPQSPSPLRLSLSIFTRSLVVEA